MEEKKEKPTEMQIENKKIKSQQWRVEYIDDCGNKHLATISNQTYLQYLQDNLSVISIKTLGK